MADALFEDPRLAHLYDVLEARRRDLDAYVELASRFGAESVLDIGCGTGTLACDLARRGVHVIGLDPASASLEVARSKPFADLVTWVLGDVTVLPPLQVDLVTMTGNVAQVFLGDKEWDAVLHTTHAALRVGGRLVFEVRDPEQQAWRGWTRELTYRLVNLPEDDCVETWIELTDVNLPLVSFRQTFVHADGQTLTSDSTLRFRDRDEIVDSLMAANFILDQVRGAPDRPGLELVVVATAAAIRPAQRT